MIGHVRFGTGFAEALAPDFFAAERARNEFTLLGVGAVGENCRCWHAHANGVDVKGNVGAIDFLFGDELETFVAAASVLGRIVAANQPRSVTLELPVLQVVALLDGLDFDGRDRRRTGDSGGAFSPEPGASVFLELRLGLGEGG